MASKLTWILFYTFFFTVETLSANEKTWNIILNGLEPFSCVILDDLNYSDSTHYSITHHLSSKTLHAKQFVTEELFWSEMTQCDSHSSVYVSSSTNKLLDVANRLQTLPLY